MGSLALFQLEETLGQTGDTVIIQMHEIGQKKLFRVFRLSLKGKISPSGPADSTAQVRSGSGVGHPTHSISGAPKAADPPQAGESEA